MLANLLAKRYTIKVQKKVKKKGKQSNGRIRFKRAI